MRLLLILGAIVGLGFAGGAAPAGAEERTCRGTLGAITVDNLSVPQGATCVLQGTRVQGTIKVERNATLRAANIKVIGNIQGENHRRVNVRGTSTIGGSIQLVQGGAARIVDATIKQDLFFDSNDLLLVARRNNVNGNLQAFQNSGGVTIAGNDIDGNLQCKENVPAPTGGNNRVGGNKEDQCRRL